VNPVRTVSRHITDWIFVAVVLVIAAANAAADQLRDELVTCRGLPDEARLACYDAAVDRGTQSASISQEELFGMNNDEVQRTVEEATGEAQLARLGATVARVQPSGYDRVLITLDNGQVWRQVDSSSLRLRVGDAIEIERASFGSFMLQKTGSKRSMRVSRYE
jgi:hypothetical protein